MATLKQKVEAAIAHIESAGGLGITCTKGYPDFRQPGLTPPVAGLFYAGSQQQAEAARRRVGASTKALALTLGVYAANEVSLFSLAEKLAAMREARPVLTAGSGASAEKIKIYVGDDERQPPDPDDPKELRHAITAPVVLTYE